MLSIKDVYEKFDEIGCCSFATLDGNGGVDSRIAHFFAYDDEGLYLRTMTGKPFFRQMIEGGRLSVCGERTDAPVVWDDENMPHFQPGYMMRVSGSVRLLTDEELSAKAAANPMFAVATYDINKYPETVVLVMDSAWGELYDYDFNMVHRDHKILRERFSWGGATFVPAVSPSPMSASSAARAWMSARTRPSRREPPTASWASVATNAATATMPVPSVPSSRRACRSECDRGQAPDTFAAYPNLPAT